RSQAGRADAHGRQTGDPALRRPAATRGAGARHCVAAAPAAVRRALVQPRPQAARADAARTQAHPAGSRHHLDLRHARSGRGPGDERRDHRDEQGPHPATRRPARNLWKTGQRLCQQLHRRHQSAQGPRAERHRARARTGRDRRPAQGSARMQTFGRHGGGLGSHHFGAAGKRRGDAAERRRARARRRSDPGDLPRQLRGLPRALGRVRMEGHGAPAQRAQGWRQSLSAARSRTHTGGAAMSVMVALDNLSKNFGAELAVNDVSLAVEQGEFVTLLGPSGCGKTTTLRCIAGLERPDGGEIHIGGDVVAAPQRGIYLNPEDRNIGMVFQSYAVWPHMTVFDNVAYGLRVRRADAEVVKERTSKALELVGLPHLADRYATKLSGGQRQRVALARAIVYEPRVILFDEPLSNLDAKLREQMRVELVRLQKEVGITSIYVTHDQSEALVMSDRVVVINNGVIQQIGDPQTIYARPANTFVANFIGVANLMEGALLGRSGDYCDVEIGLGEGRTPLRLRAAGGKDAAAVQKVTLSLRPED